MGAIITRLYWGGDPDELNEISGLTRRDVYNVQSSWGVVYKDSGRYGMMMFLGLFNKNPKTKTFFKMIKDLPEEEIKASYQFQAHVQNLMSSMNTAVLNLNEPQVVMVLMNRLGDSHRKRHIQQEHFYEFKEVVVEALVNELKQSKIVVESWGRFVDFIYKHIFDTLLDAKE